MIDYTKLSQADLNNELVKACESGDLELAKYLTTSKDLPFHADISHNKWTAVKLATASGHIEIVKHFLDDIQNHYPNIVWQVACQNGQVEILKHLFTTQEFQSEYASIWYYGGLSASSTGKTNVLDYFLNSEEFGPFIENEKIGDFFSTACAFNHINILGYLVKLSKFIQNNSLHDACNKGMIEACDRNAVDIMKYLIFNLKMNPTTDTKDHLIGAGRDDILNLFKIRELNENLYEDLKTNQEPKRRIKL